MPLLMGSKCTDHSELLVWVDESRGHVHACCVDRVDSRVACLESSRAQYIFGAGCLAQLQRREVPQKGYYSSIYVHY
jgi:hypothetical protein